MGRTPGAFAPEWRLTSSGIAVAISVFAFEAIAVATAMPRAVADLDGVAYYGWPYSSFLVLNLVGLGISGPWCDRVGPRAPLLTGVGVFAAGLLLAGMTGVMGLFVVGRGAQGLGVGLASVAVFQIVATAYPAEVRPKAMAVISTAYVLPALVGPVISGVITAHFGWRWVFLGLVPVVLGGGALLLPVLRTATPPGGLADRGTRRPLFALLAGIGVVTLQSAGNTAIAGHGAWAGLLLVVGAGALVVGLGRLLPPGTWRLGRGVPGVVGVRAMLAGSFYALESIVPLTLVALHGFGTIASGLPLLAGALGWWAGAQAQGRIDAPARTKVLRAGLLALVLCFAGMSVMALPGAAGWPVYAFWAVGGFGMGLCVPTTGVLVLDQSSETDTGHNSSALQIGDVTAAGLGTSAAGLLVAVSATGAASLNTGMVALAAAAAVVCAGAAFGAGRAGPVPALTRAGENAGPPRG